MNNNFFIISIRVFVLEIILVNLKWLDFFDCNNFSNCNLELVIFPPETDWNFYTSLTIPFSNLYFLFDFSQ